VKNLLIIILLFLCGYLAYQKYTAGNICTLPARFDGHVDNGVSVYQGSSQSSQNEVIIYTTSSCPNCKNAKAFLENRGISYTNYDIQVSAEGRERHEVLVKPFRKNGQIGVPLIIINGKIIYGFSANEMVAALQ